MKVITVPLLISLLDLTCSLATPKPSTDLCPQVDFVKRFDIERFLGDWYQYAVSGELFKYSCEKNVVMNFSMYAGGKSVIISTNRTSSKGMICRRMKTVWKADLKEPYERDKRLLYKGKLNLTVTLLDVGETSLDLLVVNTDYTNFAVLYTCKVINSVKMMAIWILTRKKRPSSVEFAAVVTVVDNTLEKNRLDHLEFRLTKQDNSKGVYKNSTKAASSTVKPEDILKKNSCNDKTQGSSEQSSTNVELKSSSQNSLSNVKSKDKGSSCQSKPKEDKESSCQGKSKDKESSCQVKSKESSCQDKLKDKGSSCQSKPIEDRESSCQGKSKDKESSSQIKFKEKESSCQVKPKENSCQDKLKDIESSCQGKFKNKERSCQSKSTGKESSSQDNPKDKESSCHGKSKHKVNSSQIKLKNKESSCQVKFKDKESSCQDNPKDKESSCHGKSQDKESSCKVKLKDEESSYQGNSKTSSCQGKSKGKVSCSKILLNDKESSYQSKPKHKESSCHGKSKDEVSSNQTKLKDKESSCQVKLKDEESSYQGNSRDEESSYQSNSKGKESSCQVKPNEKENSCQVGCKDRESSYQDSSKRSYKENSKCNDKLVELELNNQSNKENSDKLDTLRGQSYVLPYTFQNMENILVPKHICQRPSETILEEVCHGNHFCNQNRVHGLIPLTVNEDSFIPHEYNYGCPSVSDCLKHICRGACSKGVENAVIPPAAQNALNEFVVPYYV